MLLQTLQFFGNSWCKNSFLISRFLKGIFHLKPPIPRYNCTWDVSVVLNFLKGLYPLKQLSLKSLTLKVTALIAFSCAPRAQTLQSLNIDFMKVQNRDIVFSFPNLLKTSKKGKKPYQLCIERFVEEPLCCMHTILFYLKITKRLRKSRNLLISFKTYDSVSTSTIARWLKTVLQMSGIDTELFKAHSIRSAVTSAAYDGGCSLEKILKTADWSNDKIFYKFYYRSTVGTDLSFVETVFNSIYKDIM